MKNKSLIILGGLLASLFIGCEDLKFGNNFLEKPNSDDVSIDTVFSSKKYADQAMNQFYKSLWDFMPTLRGCHPEGLILDGYTDIGYAQPISWTRGDINSSSSCINFPYFPFHSQITEVTGNPSFGIRKAYIYIENVDRVTDMTADEKAIGKAEAQVIIAYHYSQMLRYYGGMPWIDHAYTAEDAMKFPRMTVEETVQKIIGLLDAAASVLPWQVDADNDGRMTAASALALKSRVLQFVASPLFNADKPYLEGDASSQFLTWYGNYSSDRWQKALDAGLEFMRANKKNSNVYQLVNTGNPRDDFAAGYFNRHNGEVLISSRRFTTYATGKLPFAQVRYGVASPTLTYVDMFQMKDGTEFDWNNPDHNKFPFFDKDGNPRRDIRLYETVAVNGDKFKGAQKVQIFEGTTQSPYKDGRMSYNGFAMRKFIRNFNDEVNGKFYSCPLIRLPEVYLNMAEAMNELNKAEVRDEFGNTAYDYLNKTRERAGMPAISAADVPAGKPLREAILRERAIEFGYEEVRYFDLIRWKRADIFTGQLSRLIIKKAAGEPSGFSYKVSHAMAETRQYAKPEKWNDKYFLLPLPVDEINKKYGLIQNPGW